MEPEEEGGRDEEEAAAPAMERAEAGVAVGSPGAPGPEEPGRLPWCKREGRGGRAGARGGGGSRWGATVPAPLGFSSSWRCHEGCPSRLGVLWPRPGRGAAASRRRVGVRFLAGVQEPLKEPSASRRGSWAVSRCRRGNLVAPLSGAGPGLRPGWKAGLGSEPGRGTCAAIASQVTHLQPLPHLGALNAGA